MQNIEYYIKQELPKAIKTIAGIEIEVEQTIYFTTLQCNLGELFKNEFGLPQFIVEYYLVFSRNGVIIPELKNKVVPKRFSNDDIVFQRSFEPETLFQPIPNPNFIEGESSEEERFLTMGAVDFIVGEIINNEEHPERIVYLTPFLKQYALDNYQEGWFDSGNLT